MPSHGVYCSATAASSRRRRAAISSSASVGKVAGFGKPPVIESTPGGLPARIEVSPSPPRMRVRRANASLKSAINAEGQRADLATVECRDVLVMVREGVQRLAPSLRGQDRALAPCDQLGGLERARDTRCRRDQQAVVVAEHDVAR